VDGHLPLNWKTDNNCGVPTVTVETGILSIESVAHLCGVPLLANNSWTCVILRMVGILIAGLRRTGNLFVELRVKGDGWRVAHS
jgi:hypothetical protein